VNRKLGIAGLQLRKDYQNQEKNLENFIKTVRIKKSQFPWIDLFFTGELFLQEYGNPDWKNKAETIPNDTTDRLCKLAESLSIWVIPGSILEKDGSKIYNTSIVINPEGKIIGKYRKIYPWAPHEDTGLGDKFLVFDIPEIGRVGVVICYDLWFPEIFRTLTWMGAEVILQPSLTCTSDRPAELVLVQAQSIMFQCYVLNVNCVCPQGGGNSIFTDPEGRVLQQAGENETVMTEVIDFDKVSWIRQFGSFGMNPLWKSFRDSAIQGDFPPYHKIQEGHIFKNLDDLSLHKNVRKFSKN
jgi:formamidase